MPANLTELDSTELALPRGKNKAKGSVQKYRDVLKNAVIKTDGEAAYSLILGVENQTEVHYAMPVKNLLYDSLNYAAQVTELQIKHRSNKDTVSSGEYLSGVRKNDKLIPVVTLVVYFGQQDWDGPMSIHEMLDWRNEGLRAFVPDYGLNLLSPVAMNPEETERFRSDFRLLADFIHCARDKAELHRLMENEAYRHLDPLTAGVANAVTNSNIKLEANERGEIDMCVAIDEIRKDGIAQGIEQGLERGIERGIEQGIVQGQELFAAMLAWLQENGRMPDVMKTISDKDFREKMLAEYQEAMQNL